MPEELHWGQHFQDYQAVTLGDSPAIFIQKHVCMVTLRISGNLFHRNKHWHAEKQVPKQAGLLTGEKPESPRVEHTHLMGCQVVTKMVAWNRSLWSWLYSEWELVVQLCSVYKNSSDCAIIIYILAFKFTSYFCFFTYATSEVQNLDNQSRSTAIGLLQKLANYGLWAKYGLLPAFVMKFY